MNNKNQLQALKRQSSAELKLQMVAPVISLDEKDPGYKSKKQKLISQIAADNSVSERSLSRWVNLYKTSGIKGLEPKYPKFRSDQKLYISFDTLLDEAAAMRRLSPTISVNEIISCLEQRHSNIAGILKRSTLQQHLAVMGCSRKQMLTEAEADGRAFFGRYRKKHVLEQVQGDIKEPPRHCCVDEYGLPIVPYINIWMDNCSRKILTYRVSVTQDESVVLSSFKELIEKYGIPETILTDQGSVYRGKSFSHCTHALGILHKRSRPYKPESKGALERLNGTLDQLLSQVKQVKGLKLSEFKLLLDEWVNEYNSKSHSALAFVDANGLKHNRNPNQVFESDRRNIRVALNEIIENAFTQKQYRKVSKDGIISFKGKFYNIDPVYAQRGELVGVAYSVTEKTVHLQVPNTEERIANGESALTYIPLQERKIGENISFNKKAVKQENTASVSTASTASEPATEAQNIKPLDTDLLSNEKHKSEDEIPPSIVRLERIIFKREGVYKDEEQFLKELKEKLIFKAEVKASEVSAYKNCKESEEH